MKIAVLGMGRMGQALAGRLLEHGHELVIWNRTPGRAPELVGRGASEAEGIAAAVDGVEVAVTSLANDEGVRQVALVDGGVRSSISEGALYVDASTVSPGLSSELDEAFPRFVAMPILGSPAAVAAGQAVYLAGGAAEAVAALDPLFPALTETVRRYSSPSLASAAKLATNLLLLDGVVALAESFAAGRAGGLSDDQLRELLADSPMVAPGLKNRFEGVLGGGQQAWWSPALGAKDAGLAIDMFEALGGDLPVTAAARSLYRSTASDPDAQDIAAVAERYQ
jgi:3-hydroxyisobutyrate dehydrogenase-like beta-hydroxyacid dehydrogenase